MLALVFAALGFLSLRPFCDLAFAGTHNDHARAVPAAAQGIHQDRDAGDAPSGTCCAGIKDGTLVKPAEPLISWTPGATLGATVFAFSGLVLARSRNPVRTPLAVPPERSYYARSARILR